MPKAARGQNSLLLIFCLTHHYSTKVSNPPGIILYKYLVGSTLVKLMSHLGWLLVTVLSSKNLGRLKSKVKIKMTALVAYPLIDGMYLGIICSFTNISFHTRKYAKCTKLCRLNGSIWSLQAKFLNIIYTNLARYENIWN